MMTVLPFEPAHLDALELQRGQQHAVSDLTQRYREMLQKAGPCYTGVLDGRIIGCAGLAYKDNQSGQLWALFAGNLGHRFIYIHNAAVRLLTAFPLRRVEATVQVGFEPGCRWLTDMLGFEYEGKMRKYGFDGSDHLLYSRTR